MKIHTQLFLLFALVLLGMTALLVTVQLVNQRVEAALDLQQQYREVRQKVFALNILAYGYMRLPLERRPVQWERVHASLGALLDDLGRSDPAGEAELRRLIKAHRALMPLIALLQEEPHAFTGERPGTAAEERRQRAAGRLSVKLNEMFDVSSRIQREKQQQTLAVQNRGARILLALAGVLALLTGTLALLLATGIARALRRMEEGAHRLAAGHLDYRIGLRSNNELGQLAVAMDDMAAKLQSRTDELQALNKEMEAFTYSVSHDLRAPLRGIDGFSQALQEDYADAMDATGRDYLQRVRLAAQRMGNLIDDLLRLSRIGRQQMLIGPVDLSAMAERIVAELREQEAQRQAEIRIQPGLQVRGDRELLRIALENLLGNAWKFTSKQSPARIEFGRTTTDAEEAFFIRDNGSGFDMAHADKLFAPFQRLHTVAEFPGTGIGASLVQRIIHRHGGRIWAEGVPGQGAVFYFTLAEVEKNE